MERKTKDIFIISALKVVYLRAYFFQTPTSLVKFIYSEKATKFCEISTLLFTGTTYTVNNYSPL